VLQLLLVSRHNIVETAGLRWIKLIGARTAGEIGTRYGSALGKRALN